MNNIDLIRKYLSNDISPEEKELFNERYKNDPDFRESFEIEKELFVAFNSVLEYEKYKEIKIAACRVAASINREVPPKKKIRLLSVKQWAVAASIAIVFYLGGWGSMQPQIAKLVEVSDSANIKLVKSDLEKRERQKEYESNISKKDTELAMAKKENSNQKDIIKTNPAYTALKEIVFNDISSSSELEPLAGDNSIVLIQPEKYKNKNFSMFYIKDEIVFKWKNEVDSLYLTISFNRKEIIHKQLIFNGKKIDRTKITQPGYYKWDIRPINNYDDYLYGVMYIYK